ncbi:MAG: CHAP domain-containing protein [bacterium]|nr:CHAP domain-containing protein [bacterium]
MKRLQKTVMIALLITTALLTKAAEDALTPCVATWDEYRYNAETKQWYFYKTYQASGNYGCELGSFGAGLEKGINVPAYSNGPAGSWTTTGLGAYQCVEYVKRFYKDARGVTINQSVDWAVNFFTQFDSRDLARFGFVKIANNGNELPKPGDIIVFGGNEPYGHAAIVKDADTSRVGVIEQNVSSDSCFATIDVKNGIIQNKGSLPTLGWLTLRIGSFSDGWHDDGTSQAILDRYNQAKAAGHPLGSPRDNNNGGVYVHNWNGVVLQDFYGDNTGFYHGYTSIILNSAGTVAHLLKEGFWDHYLNNNGPGNYGAPLTEEITAKYANSPFISSGDYVQPGNEIVVQKFQRVGTTDFTGRRTLIYNKTSGQAVRRFAVGWFVIDFPLRLC